tara:strand:- start:2140 stop:2895 length:756 start_codon:yes stop_codon:yes gene_type:complete
MAKRTVLDMTQDILIHIGSESVNSINDTDESTDVSKIIRSVYFQTLADSDWPHLRTMINFTGLGDTTTPTHMKILDNIQKIDNKTIYYDVREEATDNPVYRNIKYLEPDVFLAKILPRGANLSDTNIVEVTDPVNFYIFNDVGPTFCTSFDDENVIFDAFDAGVDTTLTGSKSNVLAYREPTFSLTDTHVPDLPSKNFPEFLAECKSAAMVAVAQEADPKQEQVAKRLRRRSEITKWRTRGGIRRPDDYGR